ncbi:MAG: hypothetical protein JWO12_1958 [Frankiales bacterium]|nr:hypothetical protein [Frankiales bacterium]
MNVMTLPRTIIGLEYKAVRYPAQLLETKVVATRFAEESRLRLGYERFLGTLDTTAGKLLADEALSDRGRVLTRRVEVLGKAISLEAKAAERKAEADAELRAKNEQAEQEKARIQNEHEQKAARLKAEREAEARAVERKAEARKRADDKAIVDSSQAIIAAERDRLDAQKAKIEARVATQTAAPKAELKTAGKNAQVAAERRDDAQRLESLREAEKRAAKK